MNYTEEMHQKDAQNETQLSTTTPVEITAEYIERQIFALFLYLKMIGAFAGAKKSMIGIWKLLTNIPMPRAIGSNLRKNLINNGFEEAANGSLQTFKNFEQYKDLVLFAKIGTDTFTVPELDTTNMTSYELSLYESAREKYLALPKEDAFDAKLKELGLTIPVFNESNIVIKGPELENLEEKCLDIPEITDFLPKDAQLINYKGHPYFYVTTRCAQDIILKRLTLMKTEMPPIFYTTFAGGTWTEEELNAKQKFYPPCEDFPKGAEFESFPAKEFALAIHTPEAYVSLIKMGTYQRYNTETEWYQYRFSINNYFILSGLDQPSDDEVKVELVNNIFPVLETITDIQILKFIQQDLTSIVAVNVDDFIISAIDKMIADLPTQKVG